MIIFSTEVFNGYGLFANAQQFMVMVENVQNVVCSKLCVLLMTFVTCFDLCNVYLSDGVVLLDSQM